MNEVYGIEVWDPKWQRWNHFGNATLGQVYSIAEARKMPVRASTWQGLIVYEVYP